jgi:uroporphyrinogen III methyltransferase/synthase
LQRLRIRQLRELRALKKAANNTAKVYLVGAGPGDPGLLTIKGQRCLESADVVIYDYLASPFLLKYASPSAEIIYVGKKGGDHTLSQEGINELLVAKAQKDVVVTRLKGGDPFIFGRGGEEAEALQRAGIPFEIVPGVTSAIAAPAYAGIPLTHRGYTSTLAVITGHEDPLKNESQIDWQALARGIGTLVFLMGVKNLPHITQQLLAQGMPAHTPVALVRWGTTPRQRTVVGNLHDIVDKVQRAGLKAPAIIVVGKVVELRDTLHWFEDRPLLGKKIVVTRARQQASHLTERLSALGAECVECPTIEIVPPKSWSRLDQAIRELDAYDWLVFTSVNAVRFFFKRLQAANLDTRALGGLRTAAIGPATAQKMQDYGLKSDILPTHYRAEAIVEAFSQETLTSRRILLPRAKNARPILPVELAQMGAVVDEVISYEAVQADEGRHGLLKQLEEKAIDAVTFTSSSTAENFKALLPKDRIDDLMAGVCIASIGPITSETASSLGFSVNVTAEEYTIPGLCQALVTHFLSD